MLVMYDGNPIPYHLGQGTLREKVNFYLDAKRAEQPGADHMLLELSTPDEQGYELMDDSHQPPLSESDADALEALQCQINELQVAAKKKSNLRFDGVEIIQRPRPFTGKRGVPPGPKAAPPTRPANVGTADRTTPRPPTPGPSGPRQGSPSTDLQRPVTQRPPQPNVAASESATPLHPYAKAKDATDPSPLHAKPAEPMRGVAGVRNTPAYRNEVTYGSPNAVNNLKEAVYKTQVSCELGELITSHDALRKAIHNDTAIRRVPVSRPEDPKVTQGSIPRPPVPPNQATRGYTVFWETVPDEEEDDEAARFEELQDSEVVEDPGSEGVAEEFSLGVDEQVDPVVTAKDRHLIRTLWCTVNETAVVECVLDKAEHGSIHG